MTRSLHYVGGAGLLVLVGIAIFATITIRQENAARDTPRVTVDRGDVMQTVAVTGTVRSEATTQLSFPTGGTVAERRVDVGDTVTAGDVLLRLTTTGIDQEINAAQARLQEAIASQQELLRGPTDESRAVLDTTVENAAANLQRIRSEQTQAVENARRTLLSTALAAEPTDPEEPAPAPTISGTYRCPETGTYTVTLYRSNADTGYSARVSGLETDTVPVSFTQPTPFGACGLRIQFSEYDRYDDTAWTVDIPNTASSKYVTNQNAYEQAQIVASSSITAAENALQLAEQQRARDTAPTRSEQRAQADARIAQVEAEIDRLETNRADRTLRAPVDSIVTDVMPTVGSSVGTRPVVTLEGGSTSRAIRVRIPEVDITSVTLEQPAVIRFDANPEETFDGTVRYLAPAPIDVNGVAYFVAHVELTNPPAWLRAGLNADVDIITDIRRDTLRLPLSFLRDPRGSSTVRLQTADGIAPTAVQVPFLGSDGYAVVDGLREGDVVVAP